MSISSCDDCERDKLEYDDVKNMSPFKGSSWSEYSYKDVCTSWTKGWWIWNISPYSTIAQDKARIQHNTIDLRPINASLSFMYNVTAAYSHMYFIMELMQYISWRELVLQTRVHFLSDKVTSCTCLKLFTGFSQYSLKKLWYFPKSLLKLWPWLHNTAHIHSIGAATFNPYPKASRRQAEIHMQWQHAK